MGETPMDSLSPAIEALSASTHELLSQANVLVLASSRDNRPWSASVYFAHRGARLYFFSSPDSRHIQEFRLHPEAAGVVSADNPEWRQIQGLQMQGRVETVRSPGEKFTALKTYLRKFRFVDRFIREQAAVAGLSPGKLLSRYLYVFIAEEAYHLDNRQGFGRRFRVDLE